MTRPELFRLLWQNIRTCNRRSLLRDTNRVAMVFTFIMMGVVAIYLVAVGLFVGLAAVEDRAQTVFVVMPVLLMVDFCMRFSLQQTPSVLIRPYLLQPVRRRDVVDCYLVSSFFYLGNLIWLCLFVPYLIITVCGGMGFLMSLAVLLTCMLLVTTNGVWYLLIRTITMRSTLWWTLPVMVYGGFVALVVFMGMDNGLVRMCYDHAFTPASVVSYIMVFAIMFVLVRRVILKCSYDETAKTDNVRLKHVSQLSFLNRYGIIGEYIRLEIKSTMRNKVVRSRLIQSIIIMVALSLILAYTDIYDSRYMGNAWCLYCFSLIGITNLSWLMGPEGNYIDMLMTHNENIYGLLRAKYYFYCAILLMPFLILLPTVLSGKYPVMMLFAYLFLTSGVEYFAMFQLAVYNRQTMPLNNRLTGKGNNGNGLQLVMSLVVLVFPMLLTRFLMVMFGQDMAYMILIIAGIVLTATNGYWLRNVYRRMMARRYDNIEGFHKTR